MQTPQYYANTARSPITAAAAAQQRLSFGPIARGKDGMEAMFCCGTNVVFLREAVEQAGGFPEQSVTEDFELSVRIHERGWRSVYLSEVVASGLGPADMSSYVSQQQRWARGCLSTIPLVLRSRLPWRTRLQYLLSAGYFLSGWTLLLYMSLPVIRLLFGIQPLAQITADQFLLHFAPYYCGALAAVALAGWGNYTFAALHSSVLLLGALPALRLRRSALLAPEPPVRHKQPRRLSTPVFAGALGVKLAIPVAVAALASQHLKAPPGLQVQARTSATMFMDNYVSADGRVIRRDQGGDTVSEGQAYAMLLAVALDDRARFESVWNWTRSHLQLGDKLLAGRWSNGAIADPRPASDADLDAARALVLADQRFGVSRYREQGAAIARAVLDNETVSAAGQTVLVAGPWARTDPAVVDPSYFSPRAYADLERVDHDARWGDARQFEPLDHLAAYVRRTNASTRLGRSRPQPARSARSTIRATRPPAAPEPRGSMRSAWRSAPRRAAWPPIAGSPQRCGRSIGGRPVVVSTP